MEYALAGLVLERGGAHEFADSGMHVHQQIHLGNLRDIALHIDDVFLRVETEVMPSRFPASTAAARWAKARETASI